MGRMSFSITNSELGEKPGSDEPKISKSETFFSGLQASYGANGIVWLCEGAISMMKFYCTSKVTKHNISYIHLAFVRFGFGFGCSFLAEFEFCVCGSGQMVKSRIKE